MYRKTLAAGSLFLLLSTPALISFACSDVEDPDGEDREKPSQVQPLESKNAALESQMRSLQRELAIERERANDLTRKLRALTPPLEGEALPVSELIAVPENYLDKEVIIEGRLDHGPIFTDSFGSLMIRDLSVTAAINCFFRPRDLDPAARRLLIAMKQHDKIRVVGRLVRYEEGLSREMKWGRNRGYEFILTKVPF